MGFPARLMLVSVIVLCSSALSASGSTDDIIMAWTEGSREGGLPVKETVFNWLAAVVEERCGLSMGLLEDEISEDGFRDFNAAGMELGAVFLVTARCDVEGSTVMLEMDPMHIYEDTSLIRDMEHFSRPHESLRFDAALLESGSEAPGFIGFFGCFAAAGVHYARGDYSDALREVDRTLDYLDEVPSETAATAYIMSAMIRMALQDYRGAIADLDRALHLDPSSVRAHMSKGMLYHYSGGSTQDVIISYARAIAADSSYYKPYLLRADLFVEQQRYEEALQDYARALELYPGDASTHLTVGIIHYRRREYSLGIEHFSSAIRFDPANEDAYYGRGLCYMEAGDTERAVEDMETLLSLSSDPVKRNMAQQQLDLLMQ